MAEQSDPSAATASRPSSDTGRGRAAPVRSADFDHLALEELRAYRDMLAEEQTQVSYGRRVLQLHLLKMRTGSSGGVAERSLRRALDRGARRRRILEVVAAGGLPALPALPPDTDSSRLATLGEIDRQLAEYQHAVHLRATAATSELIARYRERPTLAVRALPLTPVINRRDTRY